MVAKIGATSSSAPYSSEAVNKEAVTEEFTTVFEFIKVITTSSGLSDTTKAVSASSSRIIVAKDSHLQLVQSIH